MRVIISGSRHLDAYGVLCSAMLEAAEQGIVPTEIVSGRCRGVDLLGERWANERGIPIKPFEVTDEEWRRIGPRAGPLRNESMACYAEALVALPVGIGKGTRDMIARARAHGLRVYVHEVPSGY